MKIYRHGDLLIKEIKEIPDSVKQKKDKIIAYGEITGHHHKLMPTKEEFADSLKVYLDELSQKVYFETKGADLGHQEHKTIEIEAGKYEVLVEREFDYFTRRISQVVD